MSTPVGPSPSPEVRLGAFARPAERNCIAWADLGTRQRAGNEIPKNWVTQAEMCVLFWQTR